MRTGSPRSSGSTPPWTRAIEPETVRAPDLTGARAHAAARRAGIDLERWLARH